MQQGGYRPPGPFMGPPPPGMQVQLGPPGMPPPYGHMPPGMMRPGMPPPGMPGMRPPFMPQPMPGPGMIRPPIVRPAHQIFGGPHPVVLPQPAVHQPLRPMVAPAASAPSYTPPTPIHPIIRPVLKSEPARTMPDKSTNLYVGKIGPTVEDSVIKSLLEACGPVKSWKPMQDPETGKSKGFGFCEFEDAEGVLNALRMLNNLNLDGQELIVKCTTPTQKYVDAVQLRKEMEAKVKKLEKAEQKEQKVEEGEAPAAEGKSADELAEEALLEKIMSIVSSRAPQHSTAKPDAAAAATNFLATLDERPLPPPPARPSAKRPRPHEEEPLDEEQRIEEDFARERERERKEADSRLREKERLYKDKLAAWEKHEKDRRNEADKEREREKDLYKERQRQLRADLEADDDYDEPMWKRPAYSNSRRAEERRRRRVFEEEADAADRNLEAEERAAKIARGEPVSNDLSGSEGANYSSVQNGAVSEVTGGPSHQVDPEDPIYQAMMAAVKAPPPQPAPEAAPPHNEPPPHSRAWSPPPQQELPGPPPAGRANVLSVFGGDEDDDKPARKLITLEYSEAELKALREQEQRQAAPSKPVDTEGALKKLIKEIPKTWDGVSKTALNWGAYDGGLSAIAPKVRGWVSKKTADLLGEEEASMVEFVMSHLRDHGSAKKMLASLGPVLDNEAEPFVLSLYRMLIFETQKYAAGLGE